jgi:GT2 family glycosyltransferase
VKSLWNIVLNWNGVADTIALLGTLERCRVPDGWRVHTLVVDNASTDGSPEKIGAAFPSVEILRHDSNRRFAGGNNPGIEKALAAGADAVMLLNNDTEADPTMIERLLLALDQHPEGGAASPLIYFGPPSDRIWYAGATLIPALGLAAHRGLRKKDEGQYRSIESTGYLTGCCLVARAEVWRRVGLLDERYFIYAEDADWSLRAHAAGYRLLFVPTARLWHKVSASSGAQSPWKIEQRLRANLTMFARHAHGIARVTWLPAFLAQQAALCAWLLLRGQTAAAAAVPRALWGALRGRAAGEVRP